MQTRRTTTAEDVLDVARGPTEAPFRALASSMSDAEFRAASTFRWKEGEFCSGCGLPAAGPGAGHLAVCRVRDELLRRGLARR